MKNYDVVIVGGGTAGITVAARLKNSKRFQKILIIDPSEFHYYQPLWTLVGSGQVAKESTLKPMKYVIPFGVDWAQESVEKMMPEQNQIQTNKQNYSYKYLIVATGIVPNWKYAEGLEENLGKNGVCSVYNYESANDSFQIINEIESGDLIYTMPAGILKCGGAPQKIMWLAEDYISRFKNRKNFNIHFIKEGKGIFGVQKYKEVLDKMVEARNIHTQYDSILVKIDGQNKMATFKNIMTGELKEIKYQLLHVVPHFKTHEFVSSSSLANSNGEVEVDKYTLQSPKFKNVFSLGDCSSCPTGKTGAAIRKEAPVLVANLLNFDANKPMTAKYNGYTACPILTRHNRVMLAEFDYDGKPVESFPFNQATESYLMYLFKRYFLPWAYWNLMLRGYL